MSYNAALEPELMLMETYTILVWKVKGLLADCRG